MLNWISCLFIYVIACYYFVCYWTSVLVGMGHCRVLLFQFIKQHFHSKQIPQGIAIKNQLLKCGIEKIYEMMTILIKWVFWQLCPIFGWCRCTTHDGRGKSCLGKQGCSHCTWASKWKNTFKVRVIFGVFHSSSFLLLLYITVLHSINMFLFHYFRSYKKFRS